MPEKITSPICPPENRVIATMFCMGVTEVKSWDAGSGHWVADGRCSACNEQILSEPEDKVNAWAEEHEKRHSGDS